MKAKRKTKKKPAFIIDVGWQAFIKQYGFEDLDKHTMRTAYMAFAAGGALIYWTMKLAVKRAGPNPSRAHREFIKLLEAQMTGVTRAFDDAFADLHQTRH